MIMTLSCIKCGTNNSDKFHNKWIQDKNGCNFVVHYCDKCFDGDHGNIVECKKITLKEKKQFKKEWEELSMEKEWN